MPKLILMFKDRILSCHELTEDTPITIGRHRNNDIFIDNLAVSAKHAQVDFHEQNASITDLQSKNGIYVNNEKVTQSPLNNKDVIGIGKHKLVVDLTDDIKTDAPQPTSPPVLPTDTNMNQTIFYEPQEPEAPVEDTPVPEPPHPSTARLVFLKGDTGEVELKKNMTTIGTDNVSDIIITGFWALLAGDPAVTIVKQAGDHFLRFTGGILRPKRNGVSVKGTVKLKHGDIVQIGPLKLQVQLSGSS